MELIRNTFKQANTLLENFIADDKNIQQICRAADLMVAALQNGGKIISCGNGGSLCDAMHFAEELTGRFRCDRRALPAVAISDPAHITCVGNDYGFDCIFSKYIEAHGCEGDVLLAISTSGNSQNILKAVDEAIGRKMKVVGLFGKDGGRMKDKCDVNIIVPWHEYSDRIQEIHIKIIHILIECIENQLFKRD
ncbi:D-sedoheptulose 7-phosphate isomerase [Odoribacter lunatus]|uniref:D-sedoheptulose 7-phosphate isomerase n=1 Tax=Odoribacter lunatus TaxID=2941335 RepID=UPI00203FF084|nr:D-sedoheptulose 7-phosphate isomerase [Odoribacter lunatus]